MACAMCEERVQTWQGESPRCAFTSGTFSPENWNCATANAIRDLCDGVTATYCEDQSYATLRVYEVLDAPEIAGMDLALWVTWYKRRGRTDEMWLLGDSTAPRRPTEADCRQILAHYATR